MELSSTPPSEISSSVIIPASSPYGSPPPFTPAPDPITPKLENGGDDDNHEETRDDKKDEDIHDGVHTLESVASTGVNLKGLEESETADQQATEAAKSNDLEKSMPIISIEEDTTAAESHIEDNHQFNIQVPKQDLLSSSPTTTDFKELNSSSPIPPPEMAIGNLPNTKRRRLNSSLTATNKLMKPFKSPLKIDKPSAKCSSTSGPAYPPSTPPKQANVPFVPFPFAEHMESFSSPIREPMSPPPLPNKPANPSFRRSFAGVSSSGSTPQIPKKRSVSFLPQTPQTSISKDPYILSLEQKQVSLQIEIKDSRQTLDDIKQALKIEQAGEDDKLVELITKWKAAAQQAADAMFSTVEQRVARMGGVAAWRRIQERGKGGGGGWGFADDDDGMAELDDDQKKRRDEAMYEAGYDEPSMLEKKETGIEDKIDDGDVSILKIPLISLFVNLVRSRSMATVGNLLAPTFLHVQSQNFLSRRWIQ